MSETEKQIEQFRYPKNLGEQVNSLLRSGRYNQEVLNDFYNEVNGIFIKNGIEVFSSESRLKFLDPRFSPDSIPYSDIFGTRFIIPGHNIDESAQIIKEYYKSPDKFPWGVNSIRDFRKKKSNLPYSNPEYTAVHIKVPFGNQTIKDIGEIQLLTPEWKIIADESRAKYEKDKDEYWK
jgi:hypothetical protein